VRFRVTVTSPRSAFWDTSAIVPLCFHQDVSSATRRLSRSHTPMIVWWGTPVESIIAFARLLREGAMSIAGSNQARRRLEALRRTWVEILPSDGLRDLAETLPAKLAVRTGDVFQLAAALVWCRERPKGKPFVSLDRRLAGAAGQIGFEIVGARATKD
jgi:predicted nucleic acid-binding protein